MVDNNNRIVFLGAEVAYAVPGYSRLAEGVVIGVTAKTVRIRPYDPEAKTLNRVSNQFTVLMV